MDKKVYPSIFHIVGRKQLDFSEHLQYEFAARTKLYEVFKPFDGSHNPKELFDIPGKSIFNMEFCPLDDTAYTVDSERMIQVFDPRTHRPSRKPVHVVRGAHLDCVNCVTFLDDNLFATCSDDTTIKIWDNRSLYHHVAHLRGHTGWVKNIEYDEKNNLLFSIAFYDGVRKWDMNELEYYNENDDMTDNLLFPMDDPVRMKLSTAGEKMFINIRQNVFLLIDHFDGSAIDGVAPYVTEILTKRHTKPLFDALKQRKINRLSSHTLTALTGKDSYRAVMSVDFDPAGDMVGLRHIDIRPDRPRVELTTLYHVSHKYAPFLSHEKTMMNYQRYVNDTLEDDQSIDYIKEIAFSRDGRILASPHKGGVRLLAIDRKYTPCDFYMDRRFNTQDKTLHSLDLDKVQVCGGHSSPVLSCKFARRDMMFGTGCMGGHVIFHKPQI